MVSAADVLRRQWRASADRLDRRLGGVTDAEFFWEPAGSCWTVRPDPSRAGRYVIDYEEPEPEPPPLTTIAWRLVHLANGNWIYWEYAFGPGERMFPDLVIPHTGDAALRYWHDSREPITAWLEEATDDDLAQSRPSHLGERPWPRSGTVGWHCRRRIALRICDSVMSR